MAEKRRTISMLTCTRERPDMLKEMVISMCNTASHPGRIQFLVYIDDNDPTKEQYSDVVSDLAVHLQVLGSYDFLVGAPLGVPKSTALIGYRATGDVISGASDDHERRACHVLGQARATQRYAARARDDEDGAMTDFG